MGQPQKAGPGHLAWSQQAARVQRLHKAMNAKIVEIAGIKKFLIYHTENTNEKTNHNAGLAG